jgi:eukaryotic-like serine/threonine-protein kinase
MKLRLTCQADHLYNGLSKREAEMTLERWTKIQEIYQQATKLLDNDRAAFIKAKCSEDEALRTEVERLLDSQVATLLDSEATTLAALNQTVPLLATVNLEDPTVALAGAPVFADEMIGKQIGAYKIECELGRGGMGAVYLASRADEQFQKQVAIKLVKRGMDSDFVIHRFLGERQILAYLNHPNIARLLDGGATEDGLPYFVMEYVEGQPITHYCDSRRLTTVERLKLFQQVCSAVQYAHQNLIVHRDIKPGNILVTSTGEVKLLDFGIAKLLDPELSSTETTARFGRLLTPDYASPEQVKGEPITTASDIYSLGVLLYQLLTGHRPYHVTNTSPAEMVRVICEQEPDRPSTVINRSTTLATQNEPPEKTSTPEHLSKLRHSHPEKLRRQLAGDLDNVILKALRKEPSRRYRSVEHFSEDIRRHLAGRPVTARPDTFSYRTGKFIRRNKTGVSVALVFTILLLTATSLAIWQARAARFEKDKAEQRFNQVRKLANAVLFDYHDGIIKLPGSTPVRERMVKDALEYLDNLSQESGNDASLQRELASAYEKVGLVQGSPYVASFGDYQGALGSQKKALSIRETLAQATPQDVEVQTELAKSYSLVGDLLKVTGQTEGMLEHYQKAQTLLESLVVIEPANSKIRRELGTAYIRAGRAFVAGGNVSGALELYRKALALAQELSASEPNDTERQRDLFLANMYVADALSELGKLPKALEHRRKALTMAETLSAANPTNAQIRRDVGVMMQRLADTLSLAGEHRAALEYNRKALVIDEELSAADPTNATAKRDLVADYQKMGKLLLELGDVEGALIQQRKGLVISEALAAAAPSNTEARADLSNSYYKIGDALMAKKDLPGALQSYQKSLAIDESLAKDDPTNADARLTLAESHITSSDIKLKLGDTTGAMQGYRKAQEIYQALATADPSADTQQRYQAIVHEKIGDVFALLAPKKASAQAENWHEAKRLYQQSLEVWLDFQKRNTLQPDEAEKPNQVSQKLAKSEAALEKLKVK